MIDWLKNLNKDYPDFWKEYLSKFDEKSSRFVSLSIESTGLNAEKDVILSISTIAIIDNKIQVNDGFEVAIPQYKFMHDNELTNEFIIESSIPKLAEPEAIKSFIEYIGNAILVGHRIHFDIEILNVALEKISCGRIKNEALDIEVMYKKLHDINDKDFSLNELTKLLKIPLTDRISTSDDAFTIALLFLKLKSKLGL
jgi:DNA polymerase III subunit epsilon